LLSRREHTLSVRVLQRLFESVQKLGNISVPNSGPHIISRSLSTSKIFSKTFTEFPHTFDDSESATNDFAKVLNFEIGIVETGFYRSRMNLPSLYFWVFS
jgi:hypothetical protein